MNHKKKNNTWNLNKNLLSSLLRSIKNSIISSSILQTSIRNLSPENYIKRSKDFPRFQQFNNYLFINNS